MHFWQLDHCLEKSLIALSLVEGLDLEAGISHLDSWGL